MKKLILFLFLFCLPFSLLSSDEPDNTEPAQQDQQLLDPATFSKALGYSFAKGLLEDQIFDFDLEAVITGIKDAQAGNPAPLSETEYEQAFSNLQQKYFEEISLECSKQANEFLKSNKLKGEVTEVIPGKLQMSVLKEGSGSRSILETDSPLIQYSGKYLDDTIINLESEPIEISVDQLPSEVKQALIGAKLGEQRQLFIHPELALGSQDIDLAPLMILDVTIVDVNPE